jgi:gliding motility-associated-like protein
MRFTGLLLLFFLSFVANAQKQGNIWYFADHAGIDFNTGSPVALTDGAIYTLGGCATLADDNGKLLFYTDGVKVWDRVHQVMPNGDNLEGNSSSTQSGIIVPKPGDPNTFYVFTVDQKGGSFGLHYSVIDLTANSGLGDVTQKNIKLVSPVAEKLTAVQHANKRDIWVIAHGWEGSSSRDFLAYLVTSNGVTSTPIVSTCGTALAGDVSYTVGYLKVSPGGDRLASATKTAAGFVDLFSFDNTSGKVTYQQTLNNLPQAYGVEFSPDATKLYVSCYVEQSVYQFDITGTAAQVENSRVKVGTSNYTIGALQIAPDHKIYVAQVGEEKLGRIEVPTANGTACKYHDNAFGLRVGSKSGVATAGLPTFIQSYFIPTTTFTIANTCLGIPTTFQGITNVAPDSWYWDFGDPASGAKNYATDANPSHFYNTPGIYTVKMITLYQGVYDTVVKGLQIFAKPDVNLGGIILQCGGNQVVLDAKNPGMKYLWNTGDTTQKLNVVTNGKYWVTVSNGSCVRSDTVYVTYVSANEAALPFKDTVMCIGKKLKLTKKLIGAKLLWSTGDTSSSITVTKTGAYVLKITFGQCEIYDTVIVFFVPPPVVNLPNDTILCEGDSYTLDAGNKNAKYLWSTGETTQQIQVTQGGKYWVTVIGSSQCTASDTIKIMHCKANIYVPSAFSPNKDNLNDNFGPKGTDIISGHMIITNRWGEKIFETDDLVTGWNGLSKGKPAEPGVYLYSIVYWDYDGDVQYSHLVKGSVEVL